jgi:hypothetical protein
MLAEAADLEVWFGSKGSPRNNFPGLLEAPKPKHQASNKPSKSECSKRPSENHFFAPVAAAPFVLWGLEHCDLFEIWCLVVGYSADRMTEVIVRSVLTSPSGVLPSRRHCKRSRGRRGAYATRGLQGTCRPRASALFTAIGKIRDDRLCTGDRPRRASGSHPHSGTLWREIAFSARAGAEPRRSAARNTDGGRGRVGRPGGARG